MSAAPHNDQGARDAIDDRGLADPVGDLTEELRRSPGTERLAPAGGWSTLDVPLPGDALLAEPWVPSPLYSRAWSRWFRGRVFPVETLGRDMAVRCGGVQIVEATGRAVVVRTIDVSPAMVGSMTTEVAVRLAAALAEAAQYSDALKAGDEYPSVVVSGIPCGPDGAGDAASLSGLGAGELVSAASSVGIAASSLLGAVLSRHGAEGDAR